MKARCSALPRVMECAGSLAPIDDDQAHRPELEEARLGRADHELMAAEVEERPLSTAEIADYYDVSRKDAAIIRAQGRKAWAAIRPNFPWPATEVQLEGPLCKVCVAESGETSP